jgi:peptidoglycan/LPS O-acetylase OafA/YrhL
LAGADMSALKGAGWIKQLVYMLLLAEPRLPKAFAGLPYPSLNGSVWTIPYEFRCYVLIAILGLLGTLRRKMLFGVSLIALLPISAFLTIGNSAPTMLTNLTGYPQATLRFTTIFLSGSAFYIFRGAISYRNDLALIAAILLIGLLFNNATEELSMPTLGAYLIFWFAFLKNTPRLNRINNSSDVSYGIYLYAWPIQNLLMKFVPGISPLIVIMLTTSAATTLASLSWHLIEKPSLSLKRPSRRPADLQQSGADSRRQIGFETRPDGIDV